MKKITFIISIILISFSFSNCVAPATMGQGCLFNYYTQPYQAVENDIGDKIGESNMFCVLGLFCYGNASIAQAAENGDITKVGSVDARYMSILYIFVMRTTVVTGY